MDVLDGSGVDLIQNGVEQYICQRGRRDTPKCWVIKIVNFVRIRPETNCPHTNQTSVAGNRHKQMSREFVSQRSVLRMYQYSVGGREPGNTTNKRLQNWLIWLNECFRVPSRFEVCPSHTNADGKVINQSL
jgi:hypothetical protein